MLRSQYLVCMVSIVQVDNTMNVWLERDESIAAGGVPSGWRTWLQPSLNGSRCCVIYGGGALWDHCPEATMSHGSASQVYWCRSGVTGSVWGREKCVEWNDSEGCSSILTWG
jgi:hypothetical protein